MTVLSHSHNPKAISDVQREHPIFQFGPIASDPVTGSTENINQIHPQAFYSLVYTDLSAFIHREILQPLCHHLHGPLLDCLCFVHFFLGTPELKAGLQVRLHSAEYKGRITFFNLLASLILRQPRIPLAFLVTKTHPWFMFSLMGRRTPSSFSAKLLSGCSSVFQVQDFVLLVAEFCDVPVGPFLHPVKVPLAGSMCPWQISRPPSLMSLANSLSIHPYPSSGSLRMSNRTVPSIVPWWIPL